MKVCRWLCKIAGAIFVLAGIILLSGCSGSREAVEAEPVADTPPASRFDVLVFSRAEGGRHGASSHGREALRNMGDDEGFSVHVTGDPRVFTRDSLSAYEAVVFLNTTGDILAKRQQAAFEQYIRSGGGFVGVHAAADSGYGWPWYADLIGARVDSLPEEPEMRPGTVTVLDPAHPSTRSLPARWNREDEWFSYRSNPRGNVHVLATLDESSYEGGTMGHDHPIAWAHEYEGGRSWYTGLGHAAASYSDTLFRAHLLGGIEWAAGVKEGDVGATQAGTFEKVVLEDEVAVPMELTVVPDGRVFFVERGGPIKMWDPETEETQMVGFIPVSTRLEFGLIGITHDPGFAENGWLYVYYSPPAEGPHHLSRFTFRDGEIDPGSEIVMLEVPLQRQECCHTGGSLAFGPDGNLFLSTGDNTNPFASDGFAPIDEREGREPWDAQRTSGNTNSLVGKILRISPRSDGSYAIPEGNLFVDGEGRPEIFVMGNRNPYRITIDEETGWLYWGEVGPDAGAPAEGRGPAGHDEINQAREAGFYGWPYFVGDNKAYHDFDFATETSGPTFDPAAPNNDSPNNTGARVLPPAQSALIWYPYGPSEEFPELGTGGRTAMAGPVYHYGSDAASDRALPPYFDGSLFIYEWARNWIKEVKLDEEGEVLAINPFLSEMDFVRPMDMEMGPDGALYVVEYGTTWEYNDNAQIVRIDYHGSTARPPLAEARALPASGPVGMNVRFTPSGAVSRAGSPLDYSWSYPSRGDRDEKLDYAWDFDGDGRVDSREKYPTHTYETPGDFSVQLTVTDQGGRESSTYIPVTVGNSRPVVEMEWPLEGGIFAFDQPIPYEVTVSDPDGGTSEQRIQVASYLNRDAHRLMQGEHIGAGGTVSIGRGESLPYLPEDDVYGTLEATYTDAGAAGVAPLSASVDVRLQPRRKQAEHAHRTEGAGRQEDDAQRFLQVEHGDYAVYAPLNLANIESLSFRVAPESGGRIEVRLDDPRGPLLAEVMVDPEHEVFEPETITASIEEEGADTENAGRWGRIRVPIVDPGGTHALYLVFRGDSDGELMKLDWLQFNGSGMMRQP